MSGWVTYKADLCRACGGSEFARLRMFESNEMQYSVLLEGVGRQYLSLEACAECGTIRVDSKDMGESGDDTSS